MSGIIVQSRQPYRVWRDQISQLRNREMERLSRYVQLLYQFYQSDAVNQQITAKHGDEYAEQFRQSITRQAESRLITTADTYLLLWLIHCVTKDTSSNAPRLMPLPKYSHILIDEGPVLSSLGPSAVRRAVRLDETPQGTMTIVGDVEQIVSLKGPALSVGKMPELLFHRRTSTS